MYLFIQNYWQKNIQACDRLQVSPLLVISDLFRDHSQKNVHLCHPMWAFDDDPNFDNDYLITLVEVGDFDNDSSITKLVTSIT